MLQPINKHTVLKEVRTKGQWFGYIAPNNVNAGNIKDNWHLGMAICIRYEESNKAYITENSESEWVSLEEVLNSFAYYNCNGELGQRIRFWQEVK